jgi:S-formylglutathione hydrolase FrmB
VLPWSAELAGALNEDLIVSELLRGNPLGDPHERPLLVYTPPGYETEPERRYPAVYVIQGFTGNVANWRNRAPFRQPFPETADAVFAMGQAPPAIVVYADAWTQYGGSQFVDSPATGRYHSYLCEEIVPFVDARYRTIADRDHRAIMGKSSGGFGAMITPMLRPDLFQRACYARRGFPVRAVLPARLRPRRPRLARIQRRHLEVVGRLPIAGSVHQAG